MPGFSIARASTSTFDPASILGLVVSTTSVQVVEVVPRASLGLRQGDDIDALSYGLGTGQAQVSYPVSAQQQPVGPVAFSVRPNAVGLPGTQLAQEAACSPSEVAGDEYRVPIPGTNAQVFDENGVPCTTNTGFPFGLLIGDDVDALNFTPPTEIRPGYPIYFSLAPNSPSLGTLGVTPAHILKTASGTTPVVFATPAQLGLQDGDDIDAIELVENGNGTFDPRTADNPNGDVLVFSLAAGSPSLATLGGRPGDLWVPNKHTPGGPPLLAFPARASGLAPNDDLNALKGDAMFLWRLAPYPQEPPTPPSVGCVTNPIGGPEAWTPRAPIPIGREGGFGVIIGNRIYVGHGFSAFGDDSFAFVYDIPSNTWLSAASAPVGRAELVGVCAEEPVQNATTTRAKVFVLGGRSFTTGSVLNAVYAYDPVANTWEAKPSMPTARAGLGAVWVASTTSIYAFGGRNGTAPHSGTPFNVVERYNVTTGTWSTMTPMPISMMDIYSTVYDPRTNKVYVIGGFDGANATSTVQIYDVATNTWSLGAPMPTPRSNSLAGFCGGRIHVIGGYDGVNEVAVNEAYDPLTNTWSTGYLSLPNPRSEFMVAGTYTGQEIYAIGDGIFGAGGNVHDVYTCGPRVSPPPPKPSTDLVVIKSASPDPVRVGSNLTYTIVVTNLGPDVATGVLLTDTLSPVMNLVSISPSQGTCTGVGSVTCNLGNMGAGFSASVTIVVMPTEAGKHSNLVQVWANEPDPQMDNNRSVVTTQVVP